MNVHESKCRELKIFCYHEKGRVGAPWGKGIPEKLQNCESLERIGKQFKQEVKKL